jgi:hypothetical protein
MAQIPRDLRSLFASVCLEFDLQRVAFDGEDDPVPLCGKYTAAAHASLSVAEATFGVRAILPRPEGRGLPLVWVISPTAVTPEFKKAFADQIEQRRKLGISAPGEDPTVYTFLPDLNRADRFEVIAELLAARHYCDAQIGKILGGNFYRLLRQVWND